MSRVCRSVNVAPSVTMYWSVCTFVLSIAGSYTSESTPPATVYQTLEVVLRAVPTQSLRARSKWDIVPGPPGAVTAGRPAAVLEAPAGPAAATVPESMHKAVNGGTNLYPPRPLFPGAAPLGNPRWARTNEPLRNPVPPPRSGKGGLRP